MNEVVREVASTCGAMLVDTRQAIAQYSYGGIPGNAFILEHLHPNLDGAFLLADAYFNALQQAGMVGSWERAVPPNIARRELLVTELDSALASTHIRRLTNNWPFQPPGTVRQDTLRILNRVDSLMVDVLRGSKSWMDATAELGAWNDAQGRFPQALRAGLAMMQEQPYNDRPYRITGMLLARAGRLPEALGMYERADRQNSTAESRRMIGQLYVRTNRADTGLDWLERALELEPEHVGALYDQGVAYMQLERPADALATAERLLEINPGHPLGVQLLERAGAAVDSADSR
jgi:tetratricopeptide (TPR) repeat protein